MARVLVGAAGVALALVGAVLLLRQDLADLVDAVLWLGGGVVAHDFLLAPALVVAGVLAAGRLPGHWRPGLAVTAVVAGTLALATLPTVLQRPALAWWPAGLAAAGLVLTAVRAVASRTRTGT